MAQPRINVSNNDRYASKLNSGDICKFKELSDDESYTVVINHVTPNHVFLLSLRSNIVSMTLRSDIDVVDDNILKDSLKSYYVQQNIVDQIKIGQYIRMRSTQTGKVMTIFNGELPIFDVAYDGGGHIYHAYVTCNLINKILSPEETTAWILQNGSLF